MNKAQREIKKAEFLEAYEQSRGLKATSAKRIGTTIQTIWNWEQGDPEFAAKVNEIDERMKEWVVNKLMDNIDKGKEQSIEFYLRTRCGWREKQEIQVSTDGAIDVQATIAEMKRTLLEGDGK